MLIPLDTLADARLDAYARLTDAQLRSRLEPEKGIFIAESLKVIEQALKAGLEPVSLLTEEKWLPSLEPHRLLAEERWGNVPTFVLPREELRQLVGFEVTRGVLGCFRRPPERSVTDVCAGARRIAVLEEITNFTNVGAIFRSAAALGIDAVLVTPSCYDPLYRRALRVSMGTVLQVPWATIGHEATGVRGGHWAREGIPLLSSLGFTTLAMALDDDSLALDDPSLACADKLAIVLGTEGDGLSRTTIAHCDHTVRIPMRPGVDSLNVAAASAVAFWELRIR